MSFTNAMGDRKDDVRFRHPQSSLDDTPFPRYPPSRIGNAGLMLPPSQPASASTSASASEPRATLPRRFTTESAWLPSVMPFGQSQPVQTAEPLDLSTSTLHKVQLVNMDRARRATANPADLQRQLEKKRLEYEILREQRRRFEVEMQRIELRQQREEQEIAEMTQALGHAQMSTGHQSEPTTPPEYRESPFPSMLSHPHRYSTSSMMSPPGLRTHTDSSASQFTMSSSNIGHPQGTPSKIPSKSVPGSRRNSDEKESEDAYHQDYLSQRPAAALNRNSMPAVGLNFRTHSRAESPSAISLGQINTTSFLFGDDDSERPSGKKDQNSTASPGVKNYLQMNATDDKFPILVRRDDYPGLLSASSAALDLALSQSPGPESQSNGWPSSSRHRPAQHSLPANSFSLQPTVSQSNDSPRGGLAQARGTNDDSPKRTLRFDRHSTDLKMTPFPESMRATSHGSGLMGNGARPTSPPKLQSSYSTNDIPTMKSPDTSIGVNAPTNASTQQRMHNHNASLGRIPSISGPRASNRDSVAGENTLTTRESLGSISQPLRSALQANAPLFGPTVSSAGPAMPAPTPITPAAMPAFASPGYYGNYGMHMLNMNMNNMHLANQIYQPQNAYAPYQMYGYYGRTGDSQPRGNQQRRATDGDANRFANVQLESLRGEIYSLCKDQHGCRYLQKKLDERKPEHIQLIFSETNEYVVELMTDPFGNYLCQKLLEYANDEQRTTLIANSALELPTIALNQHGTRALQKMIEFISTPEQIQIIIIALQDRVVDLIQDLNGNHVIQKCLNRLSPTDAQFIFDAVGANCVIVGTHRHGCCVLQRCVDHASGIQKAHLINQISLNAFPLVQDPFGNYVVQYILDINEPMFTEPLIQRFLGHVPALSKQKFSSNVIEKCLRVAEPSMRKLLIEEILQPNELGKLLRDSYANYVVQTAMDFADPSTRTRLVDNIRPLLPAIRSTPYGRRIQGKVQAIDGRSGSSSGQMTPVEVPGSGQIPLDTHTTSRPYIPTTSAGPNAFFIPTGAFGSVPTGQANRDVNANVTSPVGDRIGSASQGPTQMNAIFPGSGDSNNQTNNNMAQQFIPAYGRPAQSGAGYYF